MSKKKSKLKKYKRQIRCVALCVFLQAACIWLFNYLVKISSPVEISEIKSVEIIVKDMGQDPVFWKSKYYVADASERYLFDRDSFGSKYSFTELEKAISLGDRISIRYHKVHSWYGSYNYIVDARSDTEVYRNIDGYYESSAVSRVITITVCAVGEVIYILFAYYQISKNIGGIARLRKYLAKRKKKARKKQKE